MPILTKLKYVGSKVSDLVEIYCLVIKSTTEYCSTAFHHSLTQQDQQKLEAIQKTSLKMILGDQHTCYEEALTLVGLEKLSSRRLKRLPDIPPKKYKTSYKLKNVPFENTH